MLSSKKLFELVINNNYDELLLAIQNKQVDFKAQNRKNSYIIAASIEYRSIECFELLVNNIPDDKVSEFNVYQSGVYQALQYYGNAPNAQNKYFIEKLLNKNIKIDENYIIYNLVVFNEFSEYILNNNPEKYLINLNMNLMVYEIIFNHCLDNNLLNDNIIKNIITKAIDVAKEEIIILVKNTNYINNVWEYYPYIINQIFYSNMSNTLLAFFVNLYNTQKPANIDVITKILNNNHYSYYIYSSNKKDIIYKTEKLEILLLLDTTHDNLSEAINKRIKDLITGYWTEYSIVINIFKGNLHNEYEMIFYITLLVSFIKKIPTFQIDLSSIDIQYYYLMKKDIKSIVNLLKVLKTLINELIKLDKLIPTELDFIKDDDTIKPFEILKIKEKRILHKKNNEISI